MVSEIEQSYLKDHISKALSSTSLSLKVTLWSLGKGVTRGLPTDLFFGMLE